MRGQNPSPGQAKRRALRKSLRASGILKGARRKGGGLR